MKCKSREVTSTQKQEHTKLEEIILKNKSHFFRKPLAGFNLDAFKAVENFLQKFDSNRPIILDLCCGVGESSEFLGQKYTDHIVIGIDKSEDRINRNNHFKKQLSKNVLILRADIIDLIRMFESSKFKTRVDQIYILYPNPYPKSTQLQKRWHGHNIFHFLMQFNSRIELRSNWKIYLDEFLSAAKIYHPLKDNVIEFTPSPAITPFERKYDASGQTLYQLVLHVN